MCKVSEFPVLSMLFGFARRACDADFFLAFIKDLITLSRQFEVICWICVTAYACKNIRNKILMCSLVWL